MHYYRLWGYNGIKQKEKTKKPLPSRNLFSGDKGETNSKQGK